MSLFSRAGVNRILRDVLDTRLSAKDWIAAVLCGDRVSCTIRLEP